MTKCPEQYKCASFDPFGFRAFGLVSEFVLCHSGFLRRLPALLIFLCAASLSAAAPPKGDANAARAEWRLPGVAAVVNGTLRVTRDGQCIVFQAQRKGDTRLTYWLFRTDTGKIQDLADLLDANTRAAAPLLSFAEPSPDGKYVALGAGALLPAPSFTAYIIDLSGGAPRPVAAGTMLFARWAAGSLAVARVDKLRKFDRLLLAAPAGPPAELPIRGCLAGADAAGKSLLIGCDPNAPDAPLGLGDTTRQSLAIVIDGKIARPLHLAARVETPAAISESGDAIAARASRGPAQAAAIAIVTPNANARVIETDDLPLAVWADALVTASDGDGVAVRLWPTQPAAAPLGTPSIRLVANAAAAAVAGRRLFYVTAGQAPVLVSVPLPAPPAVGAAEDPDELPRRTDEDKRVVPDPGD